VLFNDNLNGLHLVRSISASAILIDGIVLPFRCIRNWRFKGGITKGKLETNQIRLRNLWTNQLVQRLVKTAISDISTLLVAAPGVLWIIVIFTN
jgi:hypothetical protein